MFQCLSKYYNFFIKHLTI